MAVGGDVRRELGGSGARRRRARRRRCRRAGPCACRPGRAMAAGAVVAAAALTYAFGPWGARGASIPLTRFALTSPPGMLLNQPAKSRSLRWARHRVHRERQRRHQPSLPSPVREPRCARAPGDRSGGAAVLVAGRTSDRVLRGWEAQEGRARRQRARGLVRRSRWAWRRLVAAGRDRLRAQQPGTAVARVSSSGGAPTTLTELDAARKERGHRYPQWLPDGRHFLYVAIASTEEVSTFAASLEGGKPVEVCRGGSMGRFAPPGNLLFLDTGVNSPVRRVLARSFDPFEPADQRRRSTGSGQGQRHQLRLSQSGRRRAGHAGGAALERPALADGVARPSGRVARRGDRRLRRDQQHPEPGRPPARLLESQPGGSLRARHDHRDLETAHVRESGGPERGVVVRRAVRRVLEAVRHPWLGGARQDCRRRPRFGRVPGQGLFNYPAAWSRDGRWLVVLSTDSSGAIDLWKVPMLGVGLPRSISAPAARR